MVGKLMKHELRTIFRVLMWFMIAVVLLSVFARIAFELTDTQMPGDGTFVLEGPAEIGLILSTASTVLFWYFSVLALSVAGIVTVLVRYFKSLFTGEGYMTFSLPVTPTQLLIAKFLSALVVTVVCGTEIVLSALIAIPTQVIAELLSDLSLALPQISAFFASSPLLTVEIVLLVIAAIPTELVYLFLIASIGQLFTKYRVLITIGLYYGASFAIGILFSILLVPILQLGITVSGHLVMWAFILLLTAFDVGGFFVIRYILSHKVNLVV